MLGEDEELPPPAAQFMELGPLQAGLEGVQLGIEGVVADLAGLGQEFLEGGDFRAEMIQVRGRRELVDELVTFGVVQVVLVLLPVGDAALQLGQSARPLGRRQILQLGEEVLLPLGPAADRLVDRHRRARQPSLKDGAREGDARLPAAARLRQELVDVGGDRLVQIILLGVQLEGDRVRVPVREEPPAPEVAEVLLEPPERPWAVRAEPEDVPADLRRLPADPMRLGEQIGVDEPDEMGEAVVVPVVRGGREQEHVVGVRGQFLGDLVALGLLGLVAAPGAALGVGAALVGLVDDHEVPPFAPSPLADPILLGVIEGRDDVRGPVPGVDELLLVDRREDDVEGLAEPAEQLVLPLDGERRGAEDEDAIDGLAELHLLEEQARHDRLARPRVVRQEEAEPRLRQHPEVDGLDLVGERPDAGEAHREMPVVGVGEADAGGLDEQPQALGLNRLDGGGQFRLLAEDGGRLVAGQNRLIRRAVGQAHPALEAVPQGRTDSRTTGSAKWPGKSMRRPTGNRCSCMAIAARYRCATPWEYGERDG